MTSEQREILRVFVAEALEKLDELEGLLAEIEEDPGNRGVIDQFMRAAHTLKGSAGVAARGEIESLAHVVESVVEHLRDGRLSPTPDVFDQISRVLDALARALPAIRAGDQPETDLQQIGEAFRGWLEGAVGTTTRASERRRSQEGFLLGEYDRVRIGVLEEQGKTLSVVQVSVPDDVEDVQDWAGAALKTVRRLGGVVATQPESTAFEQLTAGQRMSILLGSDRQPGDIEAALRESLTVPVGVRFYRDRLPEQVAGAVDQVQSAVAAERNVRVDLEVLDDLLRLVGELMISRDRYRQVAGEVRDVLRDGGIASELEDSAEQLGYLTGELQDAIMRARMVPVARIFRAVKRSARRAIRETGSPFRLNTAGDDTELDKNLVDALAEPLAEFVDRLVREGEQEHSARISAARRWNHVVLTIDTTQPAPLDQETALRSAVARTGGTLEVLRSQTDGHSYAASLPLTLAIIRVMMAAVGDEVYAFPIESVKETFRLEAGDIAYVKGSPVTELRGGALSLLFLDEFLDVAGRRKADTRRVLVLSEGEQPIGVVVDALIGIREVVIKPLSQRFSAIRELRGSAILGDDQIAIILNGEVVVQQAIARGELSADERRASEHQRSLA